MDINDLTKTQLILLGLLISFVTAIVTAIAVVSVMEQSSRPVTQTIYQVVKDTLNPNTTPSPAPETPVNPAPLSTSEIVEKFQNSVGVVYQDETKTLSRPLIVIAKGKVLGFLSESSLLDLKKEYTTLVAGVEMKAPAVSVLERILFFETTKKITSEKTVVFDATIPKPGEELYTIEGNPVLFDKVSVRTIMSDDAYGTRIELTSIPKMHSGALVVNKEGKALGILLITDTTALVIPGAQLAKTFGF